MFGDRRLGAPAYLFNLARMSASGRVWGGLAALSTSLSRFAASRGGDRPAEGFCQYAFHTSVLGPKAIENYCELGRNIARHIATNRFQYLCPFRTDGVHTGRRDHEGVRRGGGAVGTETGCLLLLVLTKRGECIGRSGSNKRQRYLIWADRDC